jgi:hypothetical protein
MKEAEYGLFTRDLRAVSRSRELIWAKEEGQERVGDGGMWEGRASPVLQGCASGKALLWETLPVLSSMEGMAIGAGA